MSDSSPTSTGRHVCFTTIPVLRLKMVKPRHPVPHLMPIWRVHMHEVSPNGLGFTLGTAKQKKDWKLLWVMSAHSAVCMHMNSTTPEGIW